jgi:glycosyltransferase involved in cell wall biosynthesis
MVTVSVVIPAYGHANFLKTTIESILGQTYEDYEIIVVDDGSPDDTPRVAAEFGSAIRYIRQRNQGMAAARNTGIRHASGEVISFLDDDDLWLPAYLSTVVPHFQADPGLAALHTGYRLTTDEDGQDFPCRGTQTVPSHELYDTLIEAGFFPPSSVSVRASCLQSVGVFDEGLQGLADWDLWLRICREYRFTGIPDVLVKYRLHAGGLSSNAQHMTEDRLKAVCKHFGPPEGQVTAWPRDKRRAYSFAYRTAAFEYGIRGQSEDAWRFLRQAVSVWPEVLERLDTFYELACGDQSRGYRGKPELLDLERNGAQMLEGLDALFAEAGPSLESMRRPAYGNAYLALAMLSDQAGDWRAARRYLLRAVRANPHLLSSYSVVRRLLKLCAGRRLVSIGQTMLASQRRDRPCTNNSLVEAR